METLKKMVSKEDLTMTQNHNKRKDPTRKKYFFAQ